MPRSRMEWHLYMQKQSIGTKLSAEVNLLSHVGSSPARIARNAAVSRKSLPNQLFIEPLAKMRWPLVLSGSHHQATFHLQLPQPVSRRALISGSRCALRHASLLPELNQTVFLLA